MNRTGHWWNALVTLAALAAAAPASAHGKDLEDVIPSLYGGNGITLAMVTVSGLEHSPHFSASSLRELNSLNSQISSSLGQIGLNSAVAGYTFDLELGMPVRREDALGPLVSERARTLGKHHLNVGVTYSRSEFRLFEGDRIDDLTLVFPHDDSNMDGVLGPNPPIDLRDFELDTILVNLDLEIEQQVYALLVTYGVTDTIDVGMALPLVDMRIRADAVGTVINRGTVPIPSSSFHFFDPAVESPFSSTHGSKTGIGDLVFRVKKQFVAGNEGLPDFALVGQVKTDTGDESNFLGTGDIRIAALLVTSQQYGPIGTHVNLGWEWVEGDSRQNNLRYAAGVDIRLHERLTLILDVIGRWEHKGDGIGDHISDGAIGAKINLWRSLLMTWNFLVPLNRTSGLRANVVPTIGFEYLFGGDG